MQKVSNLWNHEVNLLSQDQKFMIIEPEINTPKQEKSTTKSDRATRSFLRILSQSN